MNTKNYYQFNSFGWMQMIIMPCIFLALIITATEVKANKTIRVSIDGDRSLVIGTVLGSTVISCIKGLEYLGTCSAYEWYVNNEEDIFDYTDKGVIRI